jgi:hypothetical protein
VILTGGGPDGMPPTARQQAELDVIDVLGRALAMPGWRTTLGEGQTLVETPPGCLASMWHVVGAFATPPNAPSAAGAGPIAVVVHGSGACTTAASGGRVFMAIPATAPAVTWVLQGSLVALPPVPGLPGLRTEVWTPVAHVTCSAAWVEYAGKQQPSGSVPGC